MTSGHSGERTQWLLYTSDCRLWPVHQAIKDRQVWVNERRRLPGPFQFGSTSSSSSSSICCSSSSMGFQPFSSSSSMPGVSGDSCVRGSVGNKEFATISTNDYLILRACSTTQRCFARVAAPVWWSQTVLKKSPHMPVTRCLPAHSGSFWFAKWKKPSLKVMCVSLSLRQILVISAHLSVIDGVISELLWSKWSPYW